VRVAEALAEARAAGLDRLDAQLLLAHHLQRPRGWLIAHDDAPLDDGTLQRWRADLRRRADGVPLAYLTGRKEFHGLSLAVAPQVLVPRPDTETLVDWAIELAHGRGAPTVVDLGTGSGAIALAVKAACPHAQVLATDASDEALAVAARNAAALQLDVAFRRGDWWQAVGARRFDIALSNPPYVAAGDAHLAALRYEPALALSPGNDGLEAIRRIVGGAGAHVAAGGWLLLEHGHDQHEAVAALLGERGFADIALRRDLAGLPRCTGGRLQSR
jgi:release factor glutamine methyltransferase